MGEEAGEAVARVNEALRRWYVAFHDYGRQFGLHLRMHSSDAAALLEITNAETRDAALTQTELARHLGLSANATSTLLSRLEDAGHIERLRSRSDRRVVHLRATPRVHEQVQHFFRDAGRDLDRIMAERPREELESLAILLAALTDELDRHRDPTPRHRTGEPAERSAGAPD